MRPGLFFFGKHAGNVALGDVAEFVRQHRGQFIAVCHSADQAGVDTQIPARQGKTEQATKLKDVVVKAPSIRQRGDTISYNVASFADANDKSLADVLKKMPGIEVSDKGEIKYNGKAINKFYIEGW